MRSHIHPSRPAPMAAHGFSLLELTIVLAIVGLLVGSLLAPMSRQLDQQKQAETRAYLEQIKVSLATFAAANGRLPCPASATSLGQESFAAGGNAGNGLCANFYNGFLPAATLSISPIDSQGFAKDGWDGPENQIRYAVYTGAINGVSNPFTRTNGMASAGMSNISATSPLLSVCVSATGITSTGCGTAVSLSSQAPVVIFSLGKNALFGGTGIDESANPNPNSANNDPVFVSHPPSAASTQNGEFDDFVTWLSLNTLFSSMLATGALP